MPHVRLFVLLALHTAGRPSSILDLTWDRVELGVQGRIQFDNPGRDRTAKGRATVPVADGLVSPLREARAAAQTDYVIEWGGSRVQSVKKGVAGAARRAALAGVTPYVLRHTAAVWMVESGKMSFEEVAQYLGHSNPSITFLVYGRFSPGHLQCGADAISRRLET